MQTPARRVPVLLASYAALWAIRVAAQETPQGDTTTALKTAMAIGGVLVLALIVVVLLRSLMRPR